MRPEQVRAAVGCSPRPARSNGGCPTPARIVAQLYAKLCREDDLLAARAERLIQVLLRCSVAVYIGGVKEVAAGLQCGVHDRTSAGLIKVSAEVVAPDAEDGDVEIADPTRVHSSATPSYQTSD